MKRRTWLVHDQKEAVENSSTPVCSTSQASFVDVVQTAYAGWSWRLRLALETSRTKASEDRQRLNSFMTGKLSIRKKIRAMARVMVKGKMWFWQFQIGTFKSVNGRRSTIPNFGDLSGNCRVPWDLGVWRRDTHVADKMRMHTHTRSHTTVL